MARTNGKSDVASDSLDLEHELPASQAPAEEAGGSAQELERAQRERDELFDRLARLQAEFENVRKRTQREQAEFKQYAAADTLKALLPVLDSFERALAAHPAADEFHAGIELIYRQFLDAMLKLGVQVIDPQGEPFDPRFHEAIEMTPSSAENENRVVGVLQRGYKLKDRLLRPAMVRVGSRS